MDFSTESSSSSIEENDYVYDGNYSTLGENGEFVIEMKNPEEMLQPELMNTFFYHILITHSVTFFLGLFGNIFTIAVMLGDKNSRNATNFFLVSLAIADLLLLLLCIPLETVQYFLIQWNKNGVLCIASRYVELLSASASVLNLCAVSLERFIVIVFPMRSRSLCTLSNCRKAILLVWIVAFLLAAPVIPAKTGYNVIYRNSERNVSVTIFYCKEENEGISLSVYKLIILFIAPALLMMICYVYVIRELWRSTRNINLLTNAKSFRSSARRAAEKQSLEAEGRRSFPHRFGRKGKIKISKTSLNGSESVQNGNKSSQLRTSTSSKATSTTTTTTVPFKTAASPKQRTLQQARQNRGDDVKKARKQVIKMLILVIILFLLCWGPKLMWSFGWKLANTLGYSSFTPEWYLVRVIFNLIPFVHSCFNPLIYSLMSKNFRRSMQKQLQRFFSFFGCKCKCCECGGGSPINHSTIPLRCTARARIPQGADSLYSSNYCQISENSTRHTEIECVSAI